MKAVVQDGYGSTQVIRLGEVPKPAPADDQILIEVCAVSLNGSDREHIAGRPLYVRMAGLRTPANPIPGSDIAGRVVAVGASVTEFQPGDQVFGELPGYRGGLAEFVCTSGRTLAHKPGGLTFEEAAALPQAGTIALNGIQIQGDVQPGQNVLINGAGGSAGLFAVQLAVLRGAQVTAVDRRSKFDYMKELGAEQVIDYEREDFSRTGEEYDLILDLYAQRPITAILRALAPGGAYDAVGGSVGVFLQILLAGSLVQRATGKMLRVLGVPQSRMDLISITKLFEAGKIKLIIDRIFKFEEAIEALRYVTEGRARGKVVVSFQDDAVA